MNQSDLILGGGQFVEKGRAEPAFVFSVHQPQVASTNRIPVRFLPHAIALHPQRPTLMAVFEKKGPGACLLDLNEMRVIRKISTLPERHFYGHGVYSADGSLLYCTEAYLDGFRGVIAVRDADSLELVGEFPSYGAEPHECQLIDGGKTMVVTNGGGPPGAEAPCVTYIDVESRQLLHRLEPTNPHLNTGHFALDGDGHLVVVSAPRATLEQTHNGGVSIVDDGNVLVSMSRPGEVVARMKGEALSVAIHEPSGVALVTHPDGDMITFWSLEEGGFLKSLDLPRPRGVTLDRAGEAFFVSFGSNTALGRIPVDTLAMDERSVHSPTWLSGSHLFNWMREVEAMGFELEG